MNAVRVKGGEEGLSPAQGKGTHLRRHGLVDRSPPDVTLGALLLDNTLV
jgi:hypothetical protein